MCYGSGGKQRWDTWSDDEVLRVSDDRPAARPVDRERGLDVRVSQAERDEVASTLARHYADGRLSLAEYEERVTAALDARTGHDLEPLLADLPVDTATVRRQVRRAAGAVPTPARDRRAPAGAGVRIPVRLVAVVAVVALAVATGPWALWLLWPALAFTGGHPGHRHRHHRYEPRPRPPAIQRL